MLSTACALALGLAVGASPAPARQQAPTDDRPFHRLAANLADDLRALPSVETAVILGAGTAAALATHPADDSLSEWAAEGHDPSYTRLGSFLGDGWVQAGAALATYAVGRASHRANVAHVGADLIRAQLVNGLATRGLKLAADRRRPSGGGHSLPSGHSSAAFASAAVLASHYGWKTGVPAYALAGFIGWTRVHDNAHWLTDVLIGSAIGTIAGRAVAARHGDRAWTIVPAASSNTAAVYVVRR